jgi:hypothetical protein
VSAGHVGLVNAGHARPVNVCGDALAVGMVKIVLKTDLWMS